MTARHGQRQAWYIRTREPGRDASCQAIFSIDRLPEDWLRDCAHDCNNFPATSCTNPVWLTTRCMYVCLVRTMNKWLRAWTKAKKGKPSPKVAVCIWACCNKSSISRWIFSHRRGKHELSHCQDRTRTRVGRDDRKSKGKKKQDRRKSRGLLDGSSDDCLHSKQLQAF